MSGRSIYDLAKRSNAKHKKAIGFASELWDIDRNAPLKSGTTEDDVIEHVRRKMYFYINEKKERRKSGEMSDSSDEEKDAREEEELWSKISNEIRVDNNDDNSQAMASEVVGDNNNENNVQHPMPPLPNMTRKERESLEQAGDEDYIPDTENNENSDEDEGGDITNTNNNDGDNDNNGENDVEEDQVPAAWTFPGFMAFVLWGPFAESDVRLKTVLINGMKRSDVTSRAQMRKIKKKKRKKW